VESFERMKTSPLLVLIEELRFLTKDRVLVRTSEWTFRMNGLEPVPISEWMFRMNGPTRVPALEETYLKVEMRIVANKQFPALPTLLLPVTPLLLPPAADALTAALRPRRPAPSQRNA
jgi:hypothetical protein